MKWNKDVWLIFTLFLLSGDLGASKSYTRSGLWQKEIEAFKEEDRIAFPSDNSILFVGSSSFRGWRDLASDYPDHRVINRAFGGSHLSDLIYFFHDIVTPYRPCQIIVYEGDNDLASGMSPDEYLNDVITFIRLVEIFLPGTPVAFLSTKPSPARVKWTQLYLMANDLVRQFAATKSHVQFIDVAQLMIDQKGEIIERYFLNDRLHLNSHGYELWRMVLLPYLSDDAIKNQ